MSLRSGGHASGAARHRARCDLARAIDRTYLSRRMLAARPNGSRPSSARSPPIVSSPVRQRWSITSASGGWIAGRGAGHVVLELEIPSMCWQRASALRRRPCRGSSAGLPAPGGITVRGKQVTSSEAFCRHHAAPSGDRRCRRRSGRVSGAFRPGRGGWVATGRSPRLSAGFSPRLQPQSIAAVLPAIWRRGYTACSGQAPSLGACSQPPCKNGTPFRQSRPRAALQPAAGFISTSWRRPLRWPVLPRRWGGQTWCRLPADGLVADDITVRRGGRRRGAYRAQLRPGRAHSPQCWWCPRVFGVHEYIRDVCRRLAKLAIWRSRRTCSAAGATRQIASVAEILDTVISKVPDAQVMGDLDACAAGRGQW